MEINSCLQVIDFLNYSPGLVTYILVAKWERKVYLFPDKQQEVFDQIDYY